MERSSAPLGWLLLGTAALSLLLGFMTGGSQTPVVAAVLPLAFGLVVTVLGLLHGFKATGETDSGAPAEGDTLQRVGKLLLVFAACFLVGSLAGAYVRINLVFAPDRALPWSAETAPPSLNSAMQWVAIQERMLALGYGRDDVETLYAIHSDGTTSGSDSTGGDLFANVPETNTGVFPMIYDPPETNGPRYTPYSAQFPPEVRDYLDDAPPDIRRRWNAFREETGEMIAVPMPPVLQQERVLERSNDVLERIPPPPVGRPAPSRFE